MEERERNVGFDKMNNDLISNLDNIHTTKLGIERIRKNLKLKTGDVIKWCVKKIKQADRITRKGKNWYVYVDNSILTINAHSYTIITAHKSRGEQNET